MARALVKTVDGALVGEIKTYTGGTLPPNFLFCDAKTIGNATSGGTARANADTVNLFTHLWTHFGNTEAPVSGGRGASAAADFAANKTIQLPDLRGRTTAGKDNMGGSAANRITSGGSGITGTTLGTAGGAEFATLSTAQIPGHTHSGNSGTVSSDHAHQAAPFKNDNTTCTPGTGRNPDHVGGFDPGGGRHFTAGINANHTHAFTSDGGTGGGQSHSSTQPTFIAMRIIRY